MKKFLSSIAVFIIASGFVFAQSAAVNVIKKALECDTVDESIAYLGKHVIPVEDTCSVRVLYAFTGCIQEQSGLYSDASKSFAKAAGVKVSQESINSFKLTKEATPQEKIVYNMLKKTPSVLVLDAVRCCLNCGEAKTALSYLNSNIRNSKDAKIQAKIKLYEVWAQLCNDPTDDQIDSIAFFIKGYLSMPEMESVRPSLLFTLWYVTDDDDAAQKIKSQYPKSPEAGVVTGKASLMPTPFWFFVPRKGNAIAKAQNEQAKNITVAKNSNVEVAKKDSADKKSGAASDSKEEKIKRQQVGLFGKKENADSLVSRLKAKGFKAYIEEEVRPSGNKYFIVIVDENEQGNMGLQLKTAGFDCYPIF